jgi:amino acid adenylation domain-containing protein
MRKANDRIEQLSAQDRMRFENAEHPIGDSTANAYVPLFERQVMLHGSSTAARVQDRELTYSELNSRADRLANQLRLMGAGPEAVMAVCMDRSLELLVSLLAVWKAGGAFVVLDPAYPKERLSLILNDCRTKILIARKDYQSQFAGLDLQLLIVDDVSCATPDEDASAAIGVSPNTSADNLAYVIYTSGSTGVPKGVAITHRSLVNHNFAICDAYQLSPSDRVLQFAPPTFDVFIEEIFPTWLSGGTVILRTFDAVSSVAGFLDFIARERISVLNLPTAYWHELVTWLSKTPLPPSVRLVIIGGERASNEAYRLWKQFVAPSVKLINAYGPTETTITATLYHAKGGEDSLPIGKPIANMHAIILDDARKPVSAGTVGELFLGGVGLARGYLNSPERTAQRFIQNPFPREIASERLYRTGDLVRCRPDGNLEFVGRVDNQVKVRGFRVEPEEVTAALRSCPDVKEGVVVAREAAPRQKQLVAYFIPERSRGPNVNDVVQFLKDKLPSYLLPTKFVKVPSLPLTPSGKIDVRALPQPEILKAESPSATPLHALSQEESLARIWREVLRINSVEKDDNFFELGGDSLQAIQIISRVRDELGVELLLSQFFQHPTICGLQSCLDKKTAARSAMASAPKPVFSGNDSRPVSFSQEMLWILHQFQPKSDAYNMPVAFHLSGPLNAQALENALNHLIQRHEALRTTFESSEELRQRVAPELRLAIPFTDLEPVLLKRRETMLHSFLTTAAHEPFDLQRGPLVRARLIRTEKNEHVFIVVMHHSISDGWSQAIFFDELGKCYSAFASDQPAPELPELKLRYTDYARWQRESLTGTLLEQHLAYWKRELAGAPPALESPDRALGADSEDRAQRASIRLPQQTVLGIKRLSRTEGTTSFTVLLAALSLTLCRWTGKKDMVIGTVVAGRNRREFENLLGCFMNFLPLRVRLQGIKSSSDLLREIRRVVLEGQAHQDCPFERIVSAVNPQRNRNRNPLYNVALLWHNYPTSGFQMTGITATSIPIEPGSALLDLRFEAEPVGEEWLFSCEYRAGLFKPKTIEHLLASFSNALESLAFDPQANIETARQKPRSWLKRLVPA